MIAIIDYNIGNLASVYNACRLLDTKATILKDPDKLKDFDRIILPGVGAFGDAIEHLQNSGMYDAIKDFAKTSRPILGICLGMQLLFQGSQEFGYTKGLGLIPGEVVPFDKTKMNKQEHKVPHIGWNKMLNQPNKLFQNLKNPYLYFVHSFHATTLKKYIIATTIYGYSFASAVQKDNIYGIQPHPEKSHNNGIAILENFIKLPIDK